MGDGLRCDGGGGNFVAIRLTWLDLGAKERKKGRGRRGFGRFLEGPGGVR